MKIWQSGARHSDGHLVRIRHGGVQRRRPSERRTPLYIADIILGNFFLLSTRYFQKFRSRGQRLYLSHGSTDRCGADRITWSSQTNFSVYSSLILPSILVKTGLAFPLAGCSFPIDSSSSIVSLSNRHFTAEIGFQICSISDWLTNQTNESARRKPF